MYFAFSSSRSPELLDTTANFERGHFRSIVEFELRRRWRANACRTMAKVSSYRHYARRQSTSWKERSVSYGHTGIGQLHVHSVQSDRGDTRHVNG